MGLDFIPGAAALYERSGLRLPDQPQKKGAINVFKRIADGLRHERWHASALAVFPGPRAGPIAVQARGGQAELDMDDFAPMREILKSCNSSNITDREVYADLKLTMADSVLMKVDKMSMSTSLEVRVPFLDHEFVEFSGQAAGLVQA
jgi:asparagine synthase (glutamine-hydrolysing)